MGIGPAPATVNEWVDLTFVNRPVWLQLHTGDPGTNGALNIADVDGRQLVMFTRTSTGIVQPTGDPAVFVVDVAASDTSITHGSLHTAAEGGAWVWNLIAVSPTAVVGGDEVKAGSMEFRVTGWTA